MIEKSDRKFLLASTKLFINYKILSENIFGGFPEVALNMKKTRESRL
jgi:hypothetical protein